jgi:RNA polymerase sigma-B factor
MHVRAYHRTFLSLDPDSLLPAIGTPFRVVGMLPTEERRADDAQLMRRCRAGDRRARALLIERYLPLARSIARRYRSSSEPMDDLVQVASLGLIKAVDRWDPARGLAFSTFAVPTIRGELLRYFRDLTWLVRPPRELAELSLCVERSRRPLRSALGTEPTTLQLAAHLGQAPEAVAEAVRAGSGRWTNPLRSDAVEDAAQASGVEQAEARATLDGILPILDRQAREILRLRFEDDLLQAQIATRVGRSQVEISRIIRSSLDKLSEHVAA